MDLSPAHFVKDEMQNRRLIVNGLLCNYSNSHSNFRPSMIVLYEQEAISVVVSQEHVNMSLARHRAS